MRIDLNFASREYVFVRKVYSVLIAGILVCVAALAWGDYGYRADREDEARLYQDLSAHQKKLSEVSGRLARLSSKVDKKVVDQAYADAQFANAAIERRAFSWTLFLNRLEELVPEGISINGIKPDFSSLEVDISGNAQNIPKVTEFMSNLVGSEYFGDIPPAFSTSEGAKDNETGKTTWAFNMKIRYIPDGGSGDAPAAAEASEQ